MYVYLSVKSYAYTTVGVTSHRLFFPLSKGHFSLARLLYLTFITMVTVAYILVAIYISGQNTSQLRHTDLLQKRRRNKGMQTLHQNDNFSSSDILTTLEEAVVPSKFILKYQNLAILSFLLQLLFMMLSNISAA